jgi:beta-ureidopropionase / N-carbamoyl-L-amino-acid hydrolase
MAEVSRQRFLDWFAELAAIGRTDTGWNRVAWTPLEVEAQRWFSAAAESVGLEVRRDGAGSVWAVTPDADDGPWTCAGSHLDTQPDGGAYDGALGVVCALEAAAAILESGVERRRPLAVVSFVDEEGARFRTACFASLAITGRLDIDEALAAMGGAEAIHGVTRESLIESRGQLARVESYLEVHVEQGKALVDRGLALGIADVLTPRQRWRAVFTGESDHAGTRAMEGRRDALVAAAPFILAVSKEARARPNAVGTVGRIEIAPGSTNSIPGRVACLLDVRAREAATIDDLVAALRARFPEADFTRESRNDGAAFDAELRQALHAGAERRGIAAGDLPSYAGHDAGILAPHVPAAMLFVRNPTGASHTPAESASDDDCVAAAQVLTDALEARLTTD